MKAWWLPPVAVGLLAATGAWAFDALVQEPAPPPAEGIPVRFPFLDGPAIPCAADGQACDRDTTVLAVRGGRTTAQDVRDATWRGRATGPTPVLPSEAEVDWLDGGVGRLRLQEGLCCDHAGPNVARPALPANRTSATLTFYAFLGDGRLQATNANATAAGRFEPASDLLQAEARTFALAPGAPGAALPAFVDKAMPDLRGRLRTLPVGGIATYLLEQHDYQDLFGPLYVTLRVEA
ncbi:MAG: hypothetical protein QOD77_1953 [Thermoplasmata archaeon]|jgi:hypothetical protein|nr:hypothetical protein [Thermoplasmata archaeon]